ncbi:MAG: hypothetical protein V7638_4593 [Acidobacteriota bacterium]
MRTRTLFITQICCFVLGISNTFSILDRGATGADEQQAHSGAFSFSRAFRPRIPKDSLNFLRRSQRSSTAAFQSTRCERMLAYRRLVNDQSSKGPPYTFPKFDEYGNLSFTNEKKRLDYFAHELKSVPNESGYIVEYRSKRHNQKPLARAKRAKDYLVRVKGVDANRLLLVNGGYQREFKIELRLGPVSSP